MPYLAIRMNPRPARAFSLIELLIVVAVLALLLGLSMPALLRARTAATQSRCTVNLRSFAQAAMAYEIDCRRLPAHAREAASAAIFPHTIKAPGFDGRPLLEPYMNVDFLACPALPAWRPSSATAANIHLNYVLTPGYYANYENNVWAPGTTWTRSDQNWTFNGRRMSVLAADRNFTDPTTTPGIMRNIVNHCDTGSGFRLQVMDTPAQRGSALLRDIDAVDMVDRFPLNASFLDGSARLLAGKDPRLVRMPDRHAVLNGQTTYLLPADH